MALFDRPYTIFYCSAIVNICYRFWVIWLWIISWPRNLGQRPLNIIQTGTIRKHRCGFLFTFHSNYGSILHHFRDKARYWSVWTSHTVSVIPFSAGLQVTSYLSNRTRFVQLNGACSKSSVVTCGVPQGSVLGCCFFYTPQTSPDWWTRTTFKSI